MSRQVTYGQPRFFNSFTVIVFVIFAALGYAGWRFVPAYFDAWSVDHILKEGLSEAYRINRLDGSAKVNAQRALVEKVQLDIQKKAGVFDPNLSVDLEQDEQNVTISAEYTVVVSHPVLFPPTHLHMKRSETTSLKRIEW